MDKLKNFHVTYLLPFAADAEAVQDRSAKRHFRHTSVMVAADERQIVRRVCSNGGIPVEILPIKKRLALFNPVSRDYKQQFMLAIFFNTQAGLSAGKALKLVIEAENGPLRQRLNHAYLILDSGGSFLEAMDALDFFDQTTLAIMEAGEKTGTLSNAINTAVEYYEARASTLKVLMATAVFTTVEVTFSILSLIGNRVAVLPAIEKQIAEDATAEKAAAIKSGIGVAYIANDCMLLISVAILVGAAVCAYGYAGGSPAFRKKVDDFILKVPAIKDIVLHGAISSSAKVAVSLIRGDVDLLAAIAIAEKSSRVPRVLNYWRSAIRRVEDGEPVSDALAQAPLENSERTLIRSHTDRAQLARAFEVISARRASMAQRAAKKFQVFSFVATLMFALVAVVIALFVALLQSEGAMSALTSR
ncbi:MAG: type II secretion system F family protein [Herminiimonas sp.]|nr:type II secretion system F family protein [Herminiimonas sp.]